jgi:hypothetical protein
MDELYFYSIYSTAESDKWLIFSGMGAVVPIAI